MKNKILTGVSILFGMMFLNAGLNKLFNYIPVPDNLPEAVIKDNAAMMEISWLLPLIAFVEILGGLLVMPPKTRALGAIILFPIAVGILLTHLTVAPEGLVMAIISWAILLWIIFDNRNKYLLILR